MWYNIYKGVMQMEGNFVEILQTLGIPLVFAVIFLGALVIIIKTIYKDQKEEKTELLKQLALNGEALKQATETNKQIAETNKELATKYEKIDDKLDQILVHVSK